MKRIISMLMICMMIFGICAVSVNANKYIQDDFNEFNGEIWCEGTRYEWLGVCEGFTAPVLLTLYTGDEDNEGCFAYAPTCPRTFTCGIDFQMEDDMDEDCYIGLWISDTYNQMIGLADDRDIYAIEYNWKNSTFYLFKNYENPFFEESDLDAEKGQLLLGQWTDTRELGMNMKTKTWINLAMRVEEGKISIFVDDKCVIVCDDERVETVGKTPTPLVYNNTKAHVIWDNFWMGDLNELKVEDETTVNNDSPAGDETEADDTTAIETKYVVVTDENGEAHTEVVTEIVTNAPKQDTNNNGTSTNKGGAQTGDMTVIVIAVMVVALGCAIVIKKVND